MSDQPSPSSPQEDPQWKEVSAAHPPLPRRVLYSGLGALVVLIILAIVAGIGLGGGFSGQKTGSSEQPAFSMELPVQVGNFVRGTVTSSRGPAPADQRLERADYSDGTARIVVLLAFPQPDLSSFLKDAGIETTAIDDEPLRIDDIRCGTSIDTGRDACALVDGTTGLLVQSLTDGQPVHDVVAQFHDALNS